MMHGSTKLRYLRRFLLDLTSNSKMEINYIPLAYKGGGGGGSNKYNVARGHDQSTLTHGDRLDYGRTSGWLGGRGVFITYRNP